LGSLRADIITIIAIITVAIIVVATPRCPIGNSTEGPDG
jgi:hypothetical protein